MKLIRLFIALMGVLSMPAFAVQPPAASRIAIVGVTGMGKSVFRTEYVRNVRRVVLLDPYEEVELGGGTIGIDELELRVPELRSGVVRLVVRPTDWADMPGELARAAAACERIGNVLFAVEEISFYVPDGPAPSQTPHEFSKLVVAGRHAGVSMAVVGQRFAQFPTVFRDNLSRVVAFRQTDPDSAAALAKRLARGVEPEAIQALPKHHFLDWSPETGVLHREPLKLAHT